MLDPYAHGISSRHHDPNASYSYSYSDEEGQPDHADIRSSDDFTSRSSAEMTNERISFSHDRPASHLHEPPQAYKDEHQPQHHQGQQQQQYREVPLVAPIPVRDTIHGIVSHYGRDHRDSMISYDSEYDESHTTNMSMSPGSSRPPRKSEDEERDDGLEELHSPVVPPAPLFDLTPGREPSPMRYKHGEPLQFGAFGLESVGVER